MINRTNKVLPRAKMYGAGVKYPNVIWGSAVGSKERGIGVGKVLASAGIRGGVVRVEKPCEVAAKPKVTVEAKKPEVAKVEVKEAEKPKAEEVKVEEHPQGNGMSEAEWRLAEYLEVAEGVVKEAKEETVKSEAEEARMKPPEMPPEGERESLPKPVEGMVVAPELGLSIEGQKPALVSEGRMSRRKRRKMKREAMQKVNNGVGEIPS